MKNIALFASGEGTNAQNVIDHFRTSDKINVVLVVCNNPDANVLKRAKNERVQTLLIKRDDFYKSSKIIDKLKSEKIDLIVLCGFLWLIPENLITSFENKIINIHPALLPKFGGKGMFGMNVHKAVIEAGETKSGISIHFVNKEYDEGKIIAQHTCDVEKTDDAILLALKVHQLEIEFLPKAIERILQKN